MIEDILSSHLPELTAIRQDIHAHPEMLFQEERTAAIVAGELQRLGFQVTTGIAKTGVGGTISNGSSSRTIGIRADMDALPIAEQTNLPYASKYPGKMHACGHDGHTAMLLGAARYLAETRNFAGTAVVIFQPAEEGGGGGRAMVEDGMMDRFGVTEVYGMHNMPGLPVGHFAVRPGPLMAAADRFTVTIDGRGAHAAHPHSAIDTVAIAAQMVGVLQTIVARNVDPLDSAVVSVTYLRAGETFNVLPQTATLKGTVRTLKPAVQDMIERRINEIAEGLAGLHGASATVLYERGYPATSNHEAETAFAVAVASEVSGAEAVDTDVRPTMGAEDFSYMLLARPGAFIFVGNGDSAGLHHPAYDFNDGLIPTGVSYWARLVEKAMPAA